MLLQRLLVSLVMLPVSLIVVLYGGWLYAVVLAVFFAIAASEYTTLMKAGGHRPAGFIVISAVLLFILARQWDENSWWLLPLAIMVTMIYHVWAYDRGRDEAGTDFITSIAGIFYIAVLASYYIVLRALPNGMWWVLLTLPAIMFADSGAYLIGSRFGRHKLTRRVSPKKSWEGYIGGILSSAIGTPLLALVYYQFGMDAQITWWHAALLGLVLGVLTLFGDLGVSMLKRQVGVKDTGNVLPGHGGIFDRTDSWLWGAPLAYFLIIWFFQ
ncbi:MAG: hypothetical protein DWQ07_12610 [Chloroflexi bacterium]|nr:MAG: hypothetical protein DWQ07_12610 [Chloroflexota bacterium]MBL1196881.1 hypothetical protein [Chloroflexota bacterium]NOH14177.1 phosphatidate cytidylyltransferase [Chloroflexota bacterium]